MLNIFDINYELCSEKLGILNLTPDNLPKKGILTRISSLIKGIYRHEFKKKSKNVIDENAILFFTIAENEILSIKDIATQTPDSYIFGIDNYKNGFPLGKIYLYSLFYIPIVLYRYVICKNKYHKKAFSYTFDGFCIAYSASYILKKYLRSINPKKIVIANQLSFFHRSLAYIAKDLKIETVYIQHASITSNFSNLNIFKTALLEGEDSLIKIQENETSGIDIYLIGMPKFDIYANKVKQIHSIKKVGICTNALDDFKAYESLLEKLCNVLPDLSITVRAHPADRRRAEWFKLAKKYGADISDVTRVKSFDFFESVDVLISGDSNIHLEAALLNMPSIYFDPLESKIDWYGFLKNKLVHYAKNNNSVISHIKAFQQNIPSVRKRAQFYVETIDTIYDGKSTLLASLIIMGKNHKSIFNVRTDTSSNIIHRLVK